MRWAPLRRRLVGLLLVGLLLVGAGAGCTSRSAPSASPAAGAGSRSRSSLAAPAITVPDPSIPRPVDRWSRSTATALDLGGGPTSTLSAVVAPSAPGTDWLIAGTRIDDDGTTTATVWSSPDGLDWTAATLSGTDGRALAATRWGSRMVVVGSVGQGSTQRAAVWVAPRPGGAFMAEAAQPGLVASRSGSAPAGMAAKDIAGTAAKDIAGTAAMDVVAAGTQGVFAAGSMSGRQAVWYSTDGADWVELTGAERVIDASPGVLVTALLVTPSAVLAAGTVADHTHTAAAMWTSPDGIGWHRLDPAGDPFAGSDDRRIDGLAVDATGHLVAVGAVRSGPSWLPASWISPDTSSWSQPSEALPTSTRSQPEVGGTVVRAVTAAGPGLLAVGGSSTAQRLWTSADGLTWNEVALPVGAARASAWSADLVGTAGATTIVVDDSPGQPRVLVDEQGSWREISAQPSIFGSPATVATPAALVADGSRLLLAVDVYRPGPVIGGGSTAVDVLTSGDGWHWERLSEASALSGSWVNSMEVISGSLVAVGSSTTPHGARVATVWRSATGRRWQVAAIFDGTSAASTAATAVAAPGATILAVGTAPATDGAVGTAPGAGAAPSVGAVPTAQAWSATGGSWTEAALDATPTVGAESVLGSCSDGHTVVVVGRGSRTGIPTDRSAAPAPAGATPSTAAVSGSPVGFDGQATDGTIARDWASATGTLWTAGTVSPLSGAGGGEEMDGCAPLDRGFVAWGQTPGPGGEAAPALWRSLDGVAWSVQTPPTLDVAGSAPLTDLAASGPDWLAVTGGDLATVADPTVPGRRADDPVTPAPTPSSASGPDGTAGVWVSNDRGATWGRVATQGPPWAAGGPLSTDLVGLLGSTAVIAGQVDGGLAVWSAAGSAPTAPQTGDASTGAASSPPSSKARHIRE